MRLIVACLIILFLCGCPYKMILKEDITNLRDGVHYYVDHSKAEDEKAEKIGILIKEITQNWEGGDK